jgi:hypothetical protein
MAWAPVFIEGKPLWIERNGILAPGWSEDPCEEECCDDGPPDPPDPEHFECNCCINQGTLQVSGLQDRTETNGAVWHWSNLNGTYSGPLDNFFGGLIFFARFAAGTCADPGKLLYTGIGGFRRYTYGVGFGAFCVLDDEPGWFRLGPESFAFHAHEFDFINGECDQVPNREPRYGAAPSIFGIVGEERGRSLCGLSASSPFIWTHPPEPTQQGTMVISVSGDVGPCDEEPPPICIPPTITITGTPPASTIATSATFTWTTTGTVGATSLRLDGGVATAPISPNIQTYHFLTPGQHTVEITVLSLLGCGNASASYTWTVAAEPCVTPTITLTQTPPASTENTTATFAWTSTGTVSLTAVRLDDLPYSNPNGSGTHTFFNVSQGTHTVEVQLQSPCGNVSAFYTWTVTGGQPCITPTVTLTQTPPTSTTSTDANFAWSTTGTVIATVIRIDGGAFTTPSGTNAHTYSNLSPGTHTVEVQVQSGACGNASAFYAWTITVPCVPPTVTLTQTPPASTSSTNANFVWTTTGTVTSVLIKLDDLPFVNPSGNNSHSFSNLSPGTHTVEVKVEAPCGTHSAFYTWEVTTPCVPPQVSFTQTPPNPTTSTSAAFAWNSTGSITQTTIRIDGGTPQPPNGANAHTFNNLATGSHTVEVFVGGPCGTDTDTYTWQITPATTLCEKVNTLFQLIGTAQPNVDVEITFSGVFASSCGLVNYNQTYLIPGPHVSVNNCPNVTVCETIVDIDGCGTINGNYPDGAWILCPNLDLGDIGGLPSLAWLLCTGCTSPGISTPPMIRVRSSVPATGTGGAQFADFAASGTAQVTALVDQMLATGSCVLPFFQQLPSNPGPTTPFPQRDFRFATCTIRIL